MTRLIIYWYFLKEDWYASDFIGIEKGITAIMIENYQSGLIWELFMQNDQVQKGLERLGFEEYEAGYDYSGYGPDAKEKIGK